MNGMNTSRKTVKLCFITVAGMLALKAQVNHSLLSIGKMGNRVGPGPMRFLSTTWIGLLVGGRIIRDRRHLLEKEKAAEIEEPQYAAQIHQRRLVAPQPERTDGERDDRQGVNRENVYSVDRTRTKKVALSANA